MGHRPSPFLCLVRFRYLGAKYITLSLPSAINGLASVSSKFNIGRTGIIYSLI
jgi:hypothetical protein